MSHPELEHYSFPRFKPLPKIVGYLAYLGLLITIIICIWVMGFKAGVNRASPTYPQMFPVEHSSATGTASWYDYELNGVLWSATHRTAASRDLPRYSYARVTNLANNESVIVYINDFGPEECPKEKPDCETAGRIIDLSSYAFSLLAPLLEGGIEVKVEPYWE